jgi:hypothetical protein
MDAVEIRGTDQDAEVKADLDRLVALVEASRVQEARTLVKELAARWPESAAIRHMDRVLEPPRVIATGTMPAPALEQEIAWLRSHAREHPGCWLAIHGDRLIAADPDRRKVVAAAREALGEEGALLFFQPPDSP